MTIFEYVGQRIRELRASFNAGEGLSQDRLAKAIGVTANTVSRWETAVYKPSLEDLDKLARFYGISILEFFPPEESTAQEQVTALLRTAKQLSPEDLEELQRYAEYRRARSRYTSRARRSGGRLPKVI